MRIVTWNINSVRAREERLLLWLDRHQPDVLCLQEIKVVTDKFPFDAVKNAGYHTEAYGQKTYNGVALISREEPTDVVRGMGDSDDDPQARVISARYGETRVICTYFPNGKTVGSPEYAYKLDWMSRLERFIASTATPDEKLVLTGDFNVAPLDTDCHDPAAWAGSVLCHEKVRSALESIRQWGFVDVFQEKHPEGGIYSWWDYRMLAFPKNKGLRIDHVFATESLAKLCTDARVDRDERKKGTVEKPSDHAPVIADFASE